MKNTGDGVFPPNMASKQINPRRLYIPECQIPECSLHSHCFASHICYLLLCYNLSQNIETEEQQECIHRFGCSLAGPSSSGFLTVLQS